MSKNKVGINKVKFRLLELWPPSVKGGFENETQISDFDNLVKVGEGSFGIVFKATYKKTGATYAIKAIDKKNKTNQEGRSYFKREIEIMYKIRHPNIVRLYTHFEDDNYCYFVMEYINKGNLFDNVDKQRKKCFDTKTVASYMKDLCSAVFYLHCMDPPIIHRDIKLENVLLHEDGKVKLTDFGWSNYICDDEVRDTFCGTPVYLAPEMIKRKEHDHNVDIWCIGVMLFELLTGKLPFNTSSKLALEDSIMKVKINWPPDMNQQARDLVSRILKYNPSERLQIENILKHTFFTTIFPNASDSLIKPPSNSEELDIYIMIQDTPEANLLSNTKITNLTNTQSSGSNNSNTDVNAIIQNLQNLLDQEKKEVIKLNAMLKERENENNDISKENVELKNKIEKLQAEIKSLEESIEEFEKQGKLDVQGLEKKNQKLLEEVEFLNERIELHKSYYKEHLEMFDKSFRESMDTNQKKMDNTVDNFRQSLSQIKPSDSGNSIAITEMEELKKNFEEEVNRLKNIMAKERENYNLVLEGNLKELKQLTEEKNKIKESTGKYYEKIIYKYDLKLKQKEIEIEELKEKQKN